MQKKYEITKIPHRTMPNLFRIRCIAEQDLSQYSINDGNALYKGLLGGFVESEKI